MFPLAKPNDGAPIAAAADAASSTFGFNLRSISYRNRIIKHVHMHVHMYIA